MTEGLSNSLGVHSSRAHGEAQTVPHRMWVTLGNVETSFLRHLTEPFMEESARHRLLRVPLRREQKIVRPGVPLLDVRLQRALQRLGDGRIVSLPVLQSFQVNLRVVQVDVANLQVE